VVPNGLPRDRGSDGLARSFSERVLIVVVREAAPLPGETGFVDNTTGSAGWRTFLTRHAISSRDGGGWPPVADRDGRRYVSSSNGLPEPLARRIEKMAVGLDWHAW
jgi:hypothetical protein